MVSGNTEMTVSRIESVSCVTGSGTAIAVSCTGVISSEVVTGAVVLQEYNISPRMRRQYIGRYAVNNLVNKSALLTLN